VLGGWLEGDLVAEGFELGDQAPGFPFGVKAGGEVVSAQFVVGPASLGVSRKLGYRDDGIEWHLVRGRPTLTRRLRLDRAGWQAARTVPVQIHGLPPCLPLFGIPAGN
jgi:hypothetical protein